MSRSQNKILFCRLSCICSEQSRPQCFLFLMMVAWMMSFSGVPSLYSLLANFYDVPCLDTIYMKNQCFHCRKTKSGRIYSDHSCSLYNWSFRGLPQILSKVFNGKLQDLGCSFLSNVHKSGHHWLLARRWTCVNPVWRLFSKQSQRCSVNKERIVRFAEAFFDLTGPCWIATYENN